MTIPSPSGAYLGIPASEALRIDTEHFLRNMEDRLPEDQNALLVSVMERFLDEVIDTLIIGMCDAVQLQGVGRKTVNVTVATLRGTAHMLSRRVLRGMKNDEVRGLASHVDDLHLTAHDADGKPVAWTVIPLEKALLAEILRLHMLIRNEPPQRHMKDTQAMLVGLMEAVVEHLYVRTMATLKLGMVSRKIVEVGYKTVHSGTHGLISRVVPQLSDEQVRDAADFIVDRIVLADGSPHPAAPAACRRATA